MKNDRKTPGNVGASSELVVCADLLRRGYQVFRAVSPCTDYDLIAEGRFGRPLRVEVRTGRYRQGKLQFNGTAEADLLAVVVGSKVTYLPRLPRARKQYPEPKKWWLRRRKRGGWKAAELSLV